MDKANDFDRRHVYSASFARSSKAIGVLWGVFTVCFAIIVVVVFIQPQWVGDTHLSKGTGYFGLWQYCVSTQPGSSPLNCVGDLKDLNSLPSAAFRASTVLVGLAVVATLLCVCCLLLFFFIRPSLVYNVAGSLQLLAALLLLSGVCVYPLGFSAPVVGDVCGATARMYNVGECEVRWAYLLAILGVLDTGGLAALAFLLGSRSKKLRQHLLLQQHPPEPLYADSLYKGHTNPDFVGDGMSLSGSRKSLNLQPVVMMRPEGETYSEYSHHPGRAKTPGYRPYSQHNFQL